MKKKTFREMGLFFLLAVPILIWIIAAACGGDGGGGSSSSPTGTVNTSISDPPTCKTPNGTFSNVFVTITWVRAHKSPNAGPNDSGWVDLVDLRDKPQQIDLLNLPDDNCILTLLGSTTGIPSGQYQQIRFYLLSNSPAPSEKTPQPNLCQGHGYNCVVLAAGGGTETLQLSSEAQTGIKIPSGQIAGGRFTVPDGQAVDLNIDFDACSSIVLQGSGQYRLKPVLHAGEISRTTNAISGVVVDNNVGVDGAIVFLEQRDILDSTIDRVVRQKFTDKEGKFIFCPLPPGNYDVVVGGQAKGKNYVPTITLDVGVGTAIGTIPLVGATAPASISGQVQAAFASGTEVDIDLWALQNATTSLRVTVPVLPGSTPNPVTVQGVPVAYGLSVPTGTPRVRSLSIPGSSYGPTPNGDYFVNAQGNCTPSSQTTPQFSVIPGGSATGKNFDFTACTGN